MTDYLIRGRAGGKTHAAIEWLHDNPRAVLLVHSNVEKARLEKKYPELKNRFYILSRIDTLRGFNGKVGIDNLDIFLQYQLGFSPDFITATGRLL